MNMGTLKVSTRKVGTLPWLLRNEARLTWRDWTEQTRPVTIAIGVALILVVLHVALWAVVRSARGALAGPLPPEAVYASALLMLATFPLLLAMGINHSVRVLFERSDLDLLVSSPLPARVPRRCKRCPDRRRPTSTDSRFVLARPPAPQPSRC